MEKVRKVKSGCWDLSPLPVFIYQVQSPTRAFDVTEFIVSVLVESSPHHPSPSIPAFTLWAQREECEERHAAPPGWFGVF